MKSDRKGVLNCGEHYPVPGLKQIEEELKKLWCHTPHGHHAASCQIVGKHLRPATVAALHDVAPENVRPISIGPFENLPNAHRLGSRKRLLGNESIPPRQ